MHLLKELHSKTPSRLHPVAIRFGAILPRKEMVNLKTLKRASK